MLSMFVNLDSFIVSMVCLAVLIVVVIVALGKLFTMIANWFRKIVANLNFGMDP